MKYFWVVLLAVIPYITISAGSPKKPKWANRTSDLNAQLINKSYDFKEVKTEGKSLKEARNRRIEALAGQITNTNLFKIEEESEGRNEQGEVMRSSVTYTKKATSQTETIRFYHTLVDEYWEKSDGTYHLFSLFATSEGDQEPQFDHFSTTTSYGAGPAFMSIIPGVGQMYKGSTFKGICMLGGVAAFGLGALFCENERSDYKNKIKGQPQFAQTYNTKANNYETARNICIGAAAAIWLYNIIDAAVAKGARKIVISPNYGSYLSLHPVATTNSLGVSLAYNFK